MLTAGEIQATTSALDALEANVLAVEEAARDARNWLAFVGIEDALTTSTRETAEGRRALFETLKRRRNEVAELATYDHEAVAEIVSMARRKAGDDLAGDIRRQVEASAPLSIAGGAITDTVADAKEAGKTAATWTAWGLIPLAVLALGAFLVWQLAPLFKGSR